MHNSNEEFEQETNRSSLPAFAAPFIQLAITVMNFYWGYHSVFNDFLFFPFLALATVYFFVVAINAFIQIHNEKHIHIFTSS